MPRCLVTRALIPSRSTIALLMGCKSGKLVIVPSRLAHLKAPKSAARSLL